MSCFSACHAVPRVVGVGVVVVGVLLSRGFSDVVFVDVNNKQYRMLISKQGRVLQNREGGKSRCQSLHGLHLYRD